MSASEPSHLCSDHGGHRASVADLPIPAALREKWQRLETRRHFLGRAGKVLGGRPLAA